MPSPIRTLPALTALLALVQVQNAHAGGEDPLTLGYVVRPGLAEIIDGIPRGTYLPVAAAVLHEAHINANWEALPQPRLIEQARHNQPNYCAAGIYQTAERSTFAKFSKPFFIDRPLVVVTLKKHEAEIRQYTSFAALTGDSKLKIGLLEGFSYGPKLDAIFAKMNGNVDRMAGTPMQNLSKLMLGRFDYTVGAADEAPRGFDGKDVDTKDIVTIDFADMAPGAPRRFMCSAAVDDAVLERINTAIHNLHLAGE